MELQIAERKQLKIKLAIQGAAGSGKSYSALLLAHGLVGDWSRIGVIDSENGSSHLYSHLGSYAVLNLSKPFTPERYCEAIDICEKAGKDVIIIDSLSQEWSGEGGVLDIHGNLPGNSFTNWAKLTPRHNHLIQTILQSRSHVISTLRTKQDYILQDKGGKFVPEKVGLAAVQRDDVSYEFSVVLDLDLKHNAISSKDRTSLFADKPPFIITETTGQMIKQWCESGTKLSDIETEIAECCTIDGLRQILIKQPEARKRIEPIVFRRKSQIEALSAVVNR